MKYTDYINPYTHGHMHRAFRLGWEAADDGLDEREAQERADRSMLNRMTTRAWWRGFRTQRANPEARMEQLEAVMLNSPGEAARAALRKGPVLVVAVRLGVGVWEPLYGLIGSWRMELPLEFEWSFEALVTLEAAATMR